MRVRRKFPPTGGGSKEPFQTVPLTATRHLVNFTSRSTFWLVLKKQMEAGKGCGTQRKQRDGGRVHPLLIHFYFFKSLTLAIISSVGLPWPCASPSPLQHNTFHCHSLILFGYNNYNKKKRESLYCLDAYTLIPRLIR